jgi:hypothetical protein
MSCRLPLCAVASFFVATATAQNYLVPESVTTKLQNLETKIDVVNLDTGSSAIGGAAIEDAAALLRHSASFPVCLEMLDYTRETDGLTLESALNQLHELKNKGKLNSNDAARLRAYEEMVLSGNPPTLVGFRKRVFLISRRDISVRGLLDAITSQDSDYVWKNLGSDHAPLVVLQPRDRSVLDWSVPAICGKGLSTGDLYSFEGKLTDAFEKHGITRPEINRHGRLPTVQVDLCREQLNARDVLNLTVLAVGGNASWTISGIRGLRWLTFE